MKFPDPPLIGRPSSRAPAVGREDGGTAPARPRRRPGAASSPTLLPARRADTSTTRPRRLGPRRSSRGGGFRVFAEEEYMRLADVREAEADRLDPAAVSRAAARTAALRVRVEAAASASPRPARSRSGLLAVATVVGGALIGALVAVADQASTRHVARRRLGRDAGAQRRARPAVAQSLVRTELDRRSRNPSGVLRSRPPRAAGRGRPRPGRSRRRATRDLVAAGAAEPAKSRHSSRVLGSPPAAPAGGQPPASRPRVHKASTDRSHETADFTFER